MHFFWNIVIFNFYLLSLFEVLGNVQDWRMCLSGSTFLAPRESKKPKSLFENVLHFYLNSYYLLGVFTLQCEVSLLPVAWPE